jgi:hypothetical protein
VDARQGFDPTFDRWRSAARTELRRLMLEVLSERDADTRAQLAHLADDVRRVQGDVETLAADLRAAVAGTAHALDKLDQRQRRDLGYALDRLATGTTAEFIAHEMPAARTFDHPYDTLLWAL